MKHLTLEGMKYLTLKDVVALLWLNDGDMKHQYNAYGEFVEAIDETYPQIIDDQIDALKRISVLNEAHLQPRDVQKKLDEFYDHLKNLPFEVRAHLIENADSLEHGGLEALVNIQRAARVPYLKERQFEVVEGGRGKVVALRDTIKPKPSSDHVRQALLFKIQELDLLYKWNPRSTLIDTVEIIIKKLDLPYSAKTVVYEAKQ